MRGYIILEKPFKSEGTNRWAKRESCPTCGHPFCSGGDICPTCLAEQMTNAMVLADTAQIWARQITRMFLVT